MKYALIIGNNKYDDPKLAQLKTPAADSQALAKVLADKNIGAFDEVSPLINKNETEIRIAISAFLSNKKPEDLVLVYFSGHGVLDDRGRLFLSLKDTRTDLLKATSLASTFISDEMDSCRSKRQILILDCCHSGAFARGTKGDQKAVTEATFEGSGYGRVVMTASDSTQYALEGDQVIRQTDLSLFTHFLLEGLKTGDADVDNDGQVSLDEWYDYTYSKVISETPNQIPHKWSYSQQGDVIIARNPNVKKRVVELPAELAQAVESPFMSIRESALNELGRLLRSRDVEMAQLARQSLEKMKDDDSRKISLEAERLLSDFGKNVTPAPAARSAPVPPKLAPELKPKKEKISKPISGNIQVSGTVMNSTVFMAPPIEKNKSARSDSSPLPQVGGSGGSVWPRWIGLAALSIVSLIALNMVNLATSGSYFVAAFVAAAGFGIMAALLSLVQVLVLRDRLVPWWIGVNTAGGLGLGLLHNYLIDHASWGFAQLGLFLAVWVIVNFSLGGVLIANSEERMNNISSRSDTAVSSSEFMKTGARNNIFLMLLSVTMIFAALYSFVYALKPDNPATPPLLIYGISSISVGILFFVRKEIPRNFGFITLAIFSILDGIDGSVSYFNTSMPLYIFMFSGIIPLATSVYFFTQRDTWKSFGLIMLSGYLLTLSLAYFNILANFLISNNNYYLIFTDISGFFALFAALLIFLGK